jgi:hypothetical protein
MKLAFARPSEIYKFIHVNFYLFNIYIPWIVRGKPPLDIGIVKINTNTTTKCTCNTNTNMVMRRASNSYFDVYA